MIYKKEHTKSGNVEHKYLKMFGFYVYSYSRIADVFALDVFGLGVYQGIGNCRSLFGVGYVSKSS